MFVSSDRMPFHSELELKIAIPAVLVGLIGIFTAMLFYKKETNLPDKIYNALGGFSTAAFHKFYIDEVYTFLLEKPFGFLSDFFFNTIEKAVLDPAVDGIGTATSRLGNLVRKLQAGNMSFYLFAMVGGILLFIIFILIV